MDRLGIEIVFSFQFSNRIHTKMAKIGSFCLGGGCEYLRTSLTSLSSLYSFSGSHLGMLRVSLSRPLVARQFSSSALKWNSLHPRLPGDSLKSESQVPPSTHHSSSTEEVLRNTSENTSTSNSSHAAQYDLELVKQRLREWTNQAALTVRIRADDFTANTKTTFLQLGSQLNKMTGYEVIEALKRDVVDQGMYLHP